MSEPQTWTIGRLLQWTSNYLKQHGSSTPRLDAEVLLAEAVGTSRITLYTRFDDDPGEQPRAAFRELVRRRAAGEPVAYLVGRREFYSLSFQVNPDVLIPRPETEFAVMALLDAIKKHPPVDRCLDIADVGTGSGAIAVTAAKHVTNCHVTAIDISPAALTVARRNAENHGVEERITFVEGDLLACVADERRFDFVISNPPYVSEAEWNEVARDVREYEPRIALVAGPEGHELVARLVPQAAARLLAGGSFVTEISPALERRIYRIVEEDGRFAAPRTLKDLAGLPRVIVAQRQ